MWIAVGIFNPVLTLLAIGMLDVRVVRDHTLVNCQALGANLTDPGTACDKLLSQMASLAGGTWLHTLVGVDATLVLMGSVLTAYVGVGGLIRRMSLDRCLPAFFLMQNPITKTNHFIVLTFFITTSSLYLIVRGDINKLAGVYAVSFLCVMALFALANMLLKYKRSKLRRAIKSSWPGVVIAFFGVIAGLILNIVKDVSIVEYFLIYFAVFLSLSLVMFVRVKILRVIYNLMKNTRCCKGPCGRRTKGWVKLWKKQNVVFFTNHGMLSVLNKAITYIRDNEFTDKVIIVHLYEGDINSEPVRKRLHRLQTNVRILDRCYPKSRISLMFAQGKFGKEAVAKISEILQIPRNFFFVASPSAPGEELNIAELGGVRLITH
jgi:amino acid transporter